jgi:serine/threonine protein phosphatase PrpC
VVSDKDLARVLGTVDDPQQAALTLKNMALDNDSKDNITCLIVHASKSDLPTPAPSAPAGG